MATDLPQNTAALDNTQTQSHGAASGAADWISHTASDVWSATAGSARVVGTVAYGVGKEIYDHPLKSVGEVAGVVALGAGLAEVGLVGTAAAAAAALPLAGYGVYRGAQIAATEGVGAIPDHIKQTFDEGKQYAGKIASAAATVYEGGGDKAKMADAQAKLQQFGYDAAPLCRDGSRCRWKWRAYRCCREGLSAAGGLVRSGLLPGLSLEPALAPALAGAGAVGADSATAGSAARALGERWQMPGTAANQPEVSYNINQSMTSDYAKRALIDGKSPVKMEVPTSGFASSMTEAFKKFARNENLGEVGNLKFSQSEHGYLKIDFLKGPRAGSTAEYKPGDSAFLLQSPGGRVEHVPLME